MGERIIHFGSIRVADALKVIITDLTRDGNMDDEPKLTGDLRVGATIFRKGVALETVQGAVDRLYEFRRELGRQIGFQEGQKDLKKSLIPVAHLEALGVGKASSEQKN